MDRGVETRSCEMTENGVDHDLEETETLRITSGHIPQSILVTDSIEYNGSLSDQSAFDHDLSSTDESQDENLTDSLNKIRDDIDYSLPLRQVLLAFSQVVNNRLDAIETKLDNLNQYCHNVEQKVESLYTTIREQGSSQNSKRTGQTVILGWPQGSPGSSPKGAGQAVTNAIGPNVTLLTLNTEADYPHGSWLGDENDSRMRVRCHVSPTDLLHVSSTCQTPEKMALTLLDYLFDRETQACSNISGTGKHKKKQLDPLIIYGIKCHLIHKFNINEKDWHRIKQNMDSKCRTAFRRKMRGMSLSVKVRDNENAGFFVPDSESELSVDQTSDLGGAGDLEQTHTIALQQAAIGIGDQTDLSAVLEGAQVIHTAEGDIQVLHATPEQIAQIQQTHHIQILTGEHVITADGPIIHEIHHQTDDNATVIHPGSSQFVDEDDAAAITLQASVSE